MAPYRAGSADRIKTVGPEVLLQPASAQTLALALHELATNAAKYGALSSITGQLVLSWKLSDGKLVIEWDETGGPPTKPPSVNGFGSRIILASIERQLRGQTTFEWRREGLRCTISVPLGSTAIELVETRGSAEGTHGGAPIAMNGGSIMLVEDEAIVALALNDALVDLGFSVLGPFTRVADARRALQDNKIDAAILDVNLNGELVYSLADTLAARKIPFVFATGYGVESIEPRFSHVPVLQKPIEKDMLTRIFVRSDSAQVSPVREQNAPSQRGQAAAV